MSTHRVASARRLRVGRFALALLLAALSTVAVAAPASAAEPTYLRLAHLSPDTPKVDVYVTSTSNPKAKAVFPGVGYGTVSAYQKVPAGRYTIAMRPAGAPASTPAVLSVVVDGKPGKAYTIAGVGSYAKLGLKVLPDDLTLPGKGTSKARVIQASASQPKLDLSLADGDVLGTEVPFATTTKYTEVSAGSQKLVVTSGSKTLATMNVKLDQRAVYSVLVLDSPNGLAVTTNLDSVATAVVPQGGVETGGGSTATSPLAGIGALAAIGAAVVLAGAVRVAVRPRGRVAA